MSIYERRESPAYSSDYREYRDEEIAEVWGAEQDAVVDRLIEEWQWHWYWTVSDAVLPTFPDEFVVRLKERPAWYNKLMYYAMGRAYERGAIRDIRQPAWKTCPLCEHRFVEDSLPIPLTRRLGMDHLDFCAPCLAGIVLQDTGDDHLTPESTLEYLRELTNFLQLIPSQGFGEGMDDLRAVEPERRTELLRLLSRRPSTSCVRRHFKSHFHALIAAGLLEEDAQRMTRGTRCLAKDGHVCLSLGEKTIDDFLHEHGVPHEKEPPYPEGRFRADFAVGAILIEYFGLKGNADYDRKTKQKQALCRRHGIELVAIYPSDLASRKKLSRKLSRVL